MKIDVNDFVKSVRDGAITEAKAVEVIRDLHRAMQSFEAEVGTSKSQILAELTGFLCDTIGCTAQEVEPERGLAYYGFNSISLTEFSRRIADRYVLKLAPSAFLEHPSLAALSAYLAVKLPPEAGAPAPAQAIKADITTRLAAASLDAPAVRKGANREGAAFLGQGVLERADDIAIVGIGARLPKSASLSDFWRKLVADEPFISEVPADRWDWQAVFGDPAVANKTDCYHGAFIDDVKSFDAMHFNIAPNEAALIDPQHRLVLQAVWETLESAGYTTAQLKQKRVGVFFGIERQDYAELIRAGGIEIDGYLNTGNASGMLVNRIAHFFDWRGPVSTVDAACASSFVAIDEAVTALRTGRAELAIAGGVNLLLTSDANIYNRKLGLFTGEGTIRPFDKQADGHVFSDGIGVVMLKPLSAAKRDNDTIHGVIKGLSVRHGGRSMYLTMPNIGIHRETIVEALEQAGLTAEAIDYIEAQGTANPLADDIELHAFHDIFRDRRAGKPKLGTLKGQLGHFSGASGVISLLKVILSLQTNTLIKIANLKELNWAADEGAFACEPLQETDEWRPKMRDGERLPRHVGIHNFGFGGVTGHLVLAEYIDARPAALRDTVFDEQVIVLSARTADQLDQLVRRLLEFLARQDWPLQGVLTYTLDDIAYTLQTGRDDWDHRAVVFADSLSSLATNLARYLEGPEDSRAFLKREAEAGKDVRQLFENPEMQSAMRHWLETRNLRSLARVWAVGVTVDWASLYAGVPLPKKVGLPTYPFAQRQLWIPARAAGHKPVARDQGAALEAAAAAPSRVETMPAQLNGMIPTLNGTGAMTPRLLACSEAFVEYAALAGGEVMDMGCAYGVATIAALEHGAQRVLAVDIDARHLSILSDQLSPSLRGRLATRCGSLPEMACPENHFTAIHAARVLHFLPPDAFRESIHKMARWLAPGGKLFITCDSPYFPHWSARVPDYERLAAEGEAWPGYIADLCAYFQQRAEAGGGHAMDIGEHATAMLSGTDLINLIDPDTLVRECELAGLEVEEVGFEGLAIDDDEMALSGTEHTSIVAVKPVH